MRISDWSSDVCSSDLNGFDFTALVAHDEPRVGGRVGGKAARHLLARRIADHHGVAALEAPLDGGDPRRQQRLALLQRLEGAGVDPETADRLQTAGNPALEGGAGLDGGEEPGRSEERRVGKEWVRTGRYRG